MKLHRVVLATVAALALLSFHYSSAYGQTYKRHALIEEGTGNWCGWCPYGAYTIDSMVAAMGENLVVISWHGLLAAPYNEPLATRAGDSMVVPYEFPNGKFAFPWASIGRGQPMAGAEEQQGMGIIYWPNNDWYINASNEAEEAPIIDFRLVNAVYSSNAVDFDLDITPLDLSTMPREDTAKYYTVAVLTEDGPQTTQEIYDQPFQSIDNFDNKNVARAVGGKVLGDVFSIKTSKTWPIRRHYHIAISNSEWVKDSLRIKAFSVFKGNKSTYETYLDAGQTTYITKLPSNPPAAIWPVTPASGQTISGDSTEIPIVWASGGGVSSVAIDYSVDNGQTWSSVVASTSQSPYEWQIPKAAYGSSVMLRISDPSKIAKDSIAPTFSIGVAPPAIITVTSPAAGDSLLVGTSHSIAFSKSGPVNEGSLTVEYSTDSMATWNTITTLSNMMTYNWTIPNSPSTTAFVRVTDANNTVGISPMFAILDSGTVSNVTIDGAPNIPVGSHETIRWDVSGYVGESLNIDLNDPQTGVHTIAHNLAADVSSYLWTTIPSTTESGYSVKVSYASGANNTSSPFNIVAAGIGTNSTTPSAWVAPNPFSTVSSLDLTLTAPQKVTLVVRDLLGREVLRNEVGTLTAGEHHIDIDGSKLAAGTYEYSVTTGSQTQTGKLTIIR